MAIEILLVEGNSGEARLVQEAFNSVAHSTSIHVVATSQEAIDFLTGCVEADSGTVPDLLLVELRLPGEDGFAVIREVRKNLDLNTLPVLVLTNSDAEEDVTRSYELHANAYLRKPDGPNEYGTIAQEIITFWVNKNHFPPE